MKIITHVPFLYASYLFLFFFIRMIFMSISVILIALDLIFLLFNIILPISHVLFLSLTPKFSLNKLIYLEIEIKRNISLFTSPDNEEILIHDNMKIMEIEVNLIKIATSLFKFNLLVGLEIFSCYELRLYGLHWILKEIVILCFGLIYASHFSFKIYEKLGFVREKWLSFGSLMMGYGIMKAFYLLFLELIPFYIL